MISGIKSEPTTVAVLGAGISGLTCATRLADEGLQVRVFDKGRGVGGRMSTRRVGQLQFDHGAQYFTVRDPRFNDAVESWLEARLVARWAGRIVVLEGGQTSRAGRDTERFVPVPAMNSICHHLATDLDVILETHVASVSREAGGWVLSQTGGSRLGTYDAVVITAPAQQTSQLLTLAAPDLARRARAVKTAPCWSVLVAYDSTLEIGFDGAFVHGSPLSWIARNNSKPRRPADEVWVLHASPEWTTSHLDQGVEEVTERLYEAFQVAVGRVPVTPTSLTGHRWRYALPTEPLAETCLIDQGLGLAACGDWCGGPRVEGAYLSGLAAADELLRVA